MQKKVVFLEGINDVKIIQKLLEDKGFSEKKQVQQVKSEIRMQKDGKVEVLLYNLKGWGTVKNSSFIDNMKIYTEQGYICYLIIDADDNSIDEGGFENRKKVVEKVIQENELSLQFFLLPDNQNDGDLETIIRETILLQYKNIYDCFIKYIECLQCTGLARFRQGEKKGMKYFVHEQFPAQIEVDNKLKISDMLDYTHKYFENIVKFLGVE